MTIAERHYALCIRLPNLPTPKGVHVPRVLRGDTLYLSREEPLLEGGTLAKGLVGRDVSLEVAKSYARRTGMVLLAAAQNILGSLDRVGRVVNVLGMVNAALGFSEQPKVTNGCSDPFIGTHGEARRRAHTAVGGTLLENISVEITVIVAVKP